MPRSSKPAPSAATEAPKPTDTSHLFQAQAARTRPWFDLTNASRNTEAFRRAGGTIEVLGTTRKR